MSKKDKPNLDLDFSDIGDPEPTTTKQAPKPIKKRPPNQKIDDRFGSIVLSIPFKEKQDRFISKTIRECSGSEFIKWANNVAYPLEQSREYYDNMANRKREFVKILTFHRKTFILANPDAIRTLH